MGWGWERSIIKGHETFAEWWFHRYIHMSKLNQLYTSNMCNLLYFGYTIITLFLKISQNRKFFFKRILGFLVFFNFYIKLELAIRFHLFISPLMVAHPLPQLVKNLTNCTKLYINSETKEILMILNLMNHEYGLSPFI